MKFSGEEKAMRVEDRRRSGKNAWAYAKENGLVPQTFTRWAKEEREGEPCFVEVPAAVPPAPCRAREILVEKGDVKIHIPLELGRGELRAVIEGFGCLL